MLALITEVAQAYLELVELDGRLAVARNSRDAFESTFTLFSKRYGAGIVSRLQVTRAQAALSAAEGTLNDIERQIAEKENQICVLVGRNPGPIERTVPGEEMTRHHPFRRESLRNCWKGGLISARLNRISEAHRQGLESQTPISSHALD